MRHITKLILVICAGLGLMSFAHAQATAPRVLAVVDGQEITDRDFQSAFKSLPPNVQARGVEQLYPHVLELLIQQIVVVGQGRKAGLAEHPAVIAQLKHLENRLVHDAYIQDAVQKRMSEALIEAEYKKIIASNQFGEEVKARHVLLKTKQEAENIIALMGQGQNFADLARQYSQGPSGPNGGDLGYFTRGRMVKEFEDVAFGMAPNTYTSTPVQTQFGWHVILVEDKREASAPTYEEMRPRLVQLLGQSLAHQVTQDAIKNAAVQRYDLNGNAIEAPKNPIPDLRNLSSQ